MPKAIHQCQKIVYGERSSWQCGFAGKVERDGKWYCGKHDPVAIKERDDKRRKQHKREMDIRSARMKIAGCERIIARAAIKYEKSKEPHSVAMKPLALSIRDHEAAVKELEEAIK